MQGNVERTHDTARSHASQDELNDAWFDAPPASTVRPRISASSPSPPADTAPPSRRSVRPATEMPEIDPVADAWFR